MALYAVSSMSEVGLRKLDDVWSDFCFAIFDFWENHMKNIMLFTSVLVLHVTGGRFCFEFVGDEAHEVSSHSYTSAVLVQF